MAKLSTPQNVVLSGTQLSFDEVTNAQWYSILANGVEIGTYGDKPSATTNAYRVVFSKPTGVTLNVTVNDNPSDPDAGIEYPAQSGWALYNGDQITVYKMGSEQHLEINGVLYNADNTTHTISVTDDDIVIGLEGTGDASGDNYVKVLINFSLSTSYGASKIYLGGNRIGNMYLGTTGLRAAYLGTNKVFGLTDTYKITSKFTNAYYCNESGTAVSAPTTIETGGSAIYWLTQAEHFNETTVAITPAGAVTYTYNKDQISRLEISKPRGPFTIAAIAIKENYPVTWTATHCTVNGANTIDYGGTEVYSIDPDQYYDLPQTITVTNATGNWDRSTGMLTISNPTGTVSFTVTATRMQYTYTEKLTNCTKLDGDLSVIYAGQTITRGFAAKAGYAFSTSVTVTGATYTWNAGSGELTISNPTGNVTVTIAAVAKTFSYSVSATNCTATPTSGTIKGGASVNIGITWNENLFSFGSSNITVTGASYSYTNGTLTISDPTQNVTVTAAATRIAYAMTAAGTDCTLSPANGYVKTDGSVTKITVTPNSGYAVTTKEGLTVTGAQHTTAMSGNNLVISLSYATGNVTVAYVAVKKYTITYKLTHCTASPQPDSLLDGYTTAFTLSPMIGWNLPNAVSVTGATVDYNSTTGKVTLSKPQYNITFTAIAAARTYNVTTNVTGCTISGPTTITTDGTATYTLTAESGYNLPTQLMVGVTNATKQSYTLNAAKTSATLVIAAPSGSVTITVNAVRVSYPVTYNLTNCTAASTNPTSVSVGGSAEFKFTANSGYELSATPTVTGATLASWDYPDSTDKTIAVAGIENVTGNVVITVVGSLLKLDTPTGVSITGDTLSFNEVDNAESYEILADGVVIGNTTGDVTYTITTTVTNGTYTGDTSIAADGTASITITANDGYTLPDEVTVTGATGTWNKTTGTLSISNPTGNATVTAECVAVQTGETWVLNKTVDWSKIVPDSDLKFMNVSYYPLISNDEYGDITIGNFTFTVEDADLENHIVMFKITDDYSVAYNRYTSSGWYAESNSEVFVSNDNALKLRTFVFSTPPTGDLLTWLQANGTKREAFILPTIARLVDASNYDLAQDTIFVTSTAKTAIEKINNEENFGLSDFIQMFLDNTVDESKKVSLEEVQEKISEKLLAYAFAARFVANTTITPDVDGYYPIDIECETLKNNDSASDVVVLCYNYVSDEFEVREPRNIVIETGIVSTEISDYKGEILTAIVYSDGGQ